MSGDLGPRASLTPNVLNKLLFLKVRRQSGLVSRSHVCYSEAVSTETWGPCKAELFLSYLGNLPPFLQRHLFCLLQEAKCCLGILGVPQILRSPSKPRLFLRPPQVASAVMCWMGWGLGDVMSFLSPLPASLGLLVTPMSQQAAGGVAKLQHMCVIKYT